MYLLLRALWARIGPHLQLLILLLGCLGAAPPAEAAQQVCHAAARAIASETGIPEEVLFQLAPTSRDARDLWPWTIRIAGETAQRFGTRDAALVYAYARFKRGARHFSIGCFQIRYNPRSRAFSSIEAMFEPEANARYAAAVLLTLHRKNRTWTGALSAYHARALNIAAIPDDLGHQPLRSVQPSDRRTVRLASMPGAT